jgi:hypothetical protein
MSNSDRMLYEVLICLVVYLIALGFGYTWDGSRDNPVVHSTLFSPILILRPIQCRACRFGLNIKHILTIPRI